MKLFIAACLLAVSLAQTESNLADAQEFFTKADVNNDEVLDKIEIKASMPQILNYMCAVDSDADGKLSRHEVLEANAANRAGTLDLSCMDESGGRICCQALTASCLACARGISETEFCSISPNTVGCPEIEETNCCKAMSASCLACTYGVTETEFCIMSPNTIGCPEIGETNCCKAMSASCLACTYGVTETEFCTMSPNTIGCPEIDFKDMGSMVAIESNYPVVVIALALVGAVYITTSVAHGTYYYFKQQYVDIPQASDIEV